MFMLHQGTPTVDLLLEISATDYSRFFSNKIFKEQLFSHKHQQLLVNRFS